MKRKIDQRTPASSRIACEVPFCRHGTRRYPAGSRWVCADHWRLTSKSWRRRLRLFRKRRRYDLAGIMWDRLRDQAIERAGGL